MSPAISIGQASLGAAASRTVRFFAASHSLPAASTEALVVLAGLGDDTTTVSGSAGPASVTIDGGLPTASDTINVTTGLFVSKGKFSVYTDTLFGALTVNSPGGTDTLTIEADVTFKTRKRTTDAGDQRLQCGQLIERRGNAASEVLKTSVRAQTLLGWRKQIDLG